MEESFKIQKSEYIQKLSEFIFRKRYERAEAEFIEAKKDLFDKKEKKELLTEHLCTIIERLEIIKADKLSELLKQLEESSEPEVSK